VSLTDPRAARTTPASRRRSSAVSARSSLAARGSVVGSFALAAALPRLWASDARRGAMSQPDLSQAM
jgi:hypothetical protein